MFAKIDKIIGTKDFINNDLRRLTTLQNDMMVVGGGSRSQLWRQIFADVYIMGLKLIN